MYLYTSILICSFICLFVYVFLSYCFGLLQAHSWTLLRGASALVELKPYGFGTQEATYQHIWMHLRLIQEHPDNMAYPILLTSLDHFVQSCGLYGFVMPCGVPTHMLT